MFQAQCSPASAEKLSPLHAPFFVRDNMVSFGTRHCVLDAYDSLLFFFFPDYETR